MTWRTLIREDFSTDMDGYYTPFVGRSFTGNAGTAYLSATYNWGATGPYTQSPNPYPGDTNFRLRSGGVHVSGGVLRGLPDEYCVKHFNPGVYGTLQDPILSFTSDTYNLTKPYGWDDNYPYPPPALVGLGKNYQWVFGLGGGVFIGQGMRVSAEISLSGPVSAWHRSIGDDGRVSFYVEAPNGDWGYGAVSPDETFWEWEFDGQYDSVVDAGTGDITTAVTIEVFPDRAVFFFGVSKEASFGGRVFPPDSQVWLTCAPPATHDRMGTWGNSISIDYNNIIDPRVGGISLFEIQAFESTGFWRSLKNTTEV